MHYTKSPCSNLSAVDFARQRRFLRFSKNLPEFCQNPHFAHFLFLKRFFWKLILDENKWFEHKPPNPPNHPKSEQYYWIWNTLYIWRIFENFKIKKLNISIRTRIFASNSHIVLERNLECSASNKNNGKSNFTLIQTSFIHNIWSICVWRHNVSFQSRGIFGYFVRDQLKRIIKLLYPFELVLHYGWRRTKMMCEQNVDCKRNTLSNVCRKIHSFQLNRSATKRKKTSCTAASMPSDHRFPGRWFSCKMQKTIFISKFS